MIDRTSVVFSDASPGLGAGRCRQRFGPALRIAAAVALIFGAGLGLGVGNLLTGSPAPARGRADAAGDASAPRSGDDDGFSISLSSPREPYLIGRQSITVEATVPAGDRVAQVDFFLDGRLILTDRKSPYVCEADLGESIERHTIIVSAITLAGRRAKVSFISRSAELTGVEGRRVNAVPVVVRDAAGRPVEGLSVSDFVLLEDGSPRRIVHFDDEPGPMSLLVALQSPAAVPAARRPLLDAAGLFIDVLPSYHALAFIDGGYAPAPALGTRGARATAPGAAPAPPTIEFSYLRTLFTRDLGDAAVMERPGSRPLASVIGEAAEALRSRPGDHVLVALLAAEPAREPAPDGGGEPAATAAAPLRPAIATSAVLDTGVATAARADVPPRIDPLQEALTALRQARVVLHAVILGQPGDEDGVGAFGALQEAALESGGGVRWVAQPALLRSACQEIAESLVHQYRLCYLPEARRAAGWSRLELRVRRQGMTVQAPRSCWNEEPAAAAAGR